MRAFNVLLDIGDAKEKCYEDEFTAEFASDDESGSKDASKEGTKEHTSAYAQIAFSEAQGGGSSSSSSAQAHRVGAEEEAHSCGDCGRQMSSCDGKV
jgi:hypothetical protein